MVVHEACLTGGVGAEVASRIQSELFDELKAPVARVCGKDTHIPQNAYLEKYCLPSPDEVTDGLRTLAARQRIAAVV